MLPRSVAVLPCHLGWHTLLKCNKTNHACPPAQKLYGTNLQFTAIHTGTVMSQSLLIYILRQGPPQVHNFNTHHINVCIEVVYQASGPIQEANYFTRVQTAAL
jgi:hypothetical protein